MTYQSVFHLAQLSNTQLIVVAKNRTVSEIQHVIDQGANALAFNRVQEAEEKFPHLRFDGQKHLIGHLQRNKVRKAVELFDMIQSVDSLKLLERIERIAGEVGKVQDVLLQVNVAGDGDKFGFHAAELLSCTEQTASFTNICVCGVMTIGFYGATGDQSRQTFEDLVRVFEQIKRQNIFGDSFVEISMGMSGDYELAIECGATMVRVGSGCFE